MQTVEPTLCRTSRVVFWSLASGGLWTASDLTVTVVRPSCLLKAQMSPKSYVLDALTATSPRGKRNERSCQSVPLLIFLIKSKFERSLLRSHDIFVYWPLLQADGFLLACLPNS